MQTSKAFRKNHMTYSQIIYTALLVMLPSTFSAALSLSSAMNIARKNSTEIDQSRFEIRKEQANLFYSDRIYDTNLKLDSSQSRDRTQQETLSSITDATITASSFSLQKLFPWGFSTYGGIYQTKTEVEVPDAVLQAGQGPIYNPQFESELRIGVQVDLWRNLANKEYDLLKNASRADLYTASFTARIREQAVLYETEKLYWKYLSMKSQSQVLAQLVKSTSRFKKSMIQRAKLGRADQVDVAAAEALEIENETNLLSARISMAQIKQLLALRIYGKLNQSSPLYIKSSTLPETAPYNLNIETIGLNIVPQSQYHQKYLNWGMKNRFDVKLLRQQQKSVRSAFLWANEIRKPNISMYAQASAIGRGDNDQTSQEAADEVNQQTVGIKLDWAIDGTEFKSKRMATIADRHIINAKINSIQKELSESLAQSFARIDGSKRRMKQSQRNLFSLNKKIKAETIKLSQARSDEVVVIKYKMEALAAELKKLQAKEEYLQSHADLRYALHKYPIVSDSQLQKLPN